MTGCLRVGLTGGIGSGKSTVERYFQELGAPTIDADAISRRVAEPGQPAFADLVALFGPEVVDDSGRLRRPLMRERAFKDLALKKRLEAVIHPLVRQEIQAFIDAADGPYCVICVPLLLETGGARERMDRILVVDAPEALQASRASRRDQADAAQIRQIIAAQISREERLRAADDVISNDGSLENLKLQVERLHYKYLELASRPGALRP